MIATPLICRCPHCGTTVEVPPEAANQVAACPSCGKQFQAELPAANLTPPPTTANGQPTAASGIPTVNPAPALAGTEPAQPPEVVLEVVRVSMWRRYPFRCTGYLLLIIAASIGAIVALSQDRPYLALAAVVVLALTLIRFIPWWLRMRNTTVTITNRRCILESGIIHHEAIEFERNDVIDVQVAQSGLMRLFNVGDLVIRSGVNTRKEVVLMAVPDPLTVASHLRDLNVAAPQPTAPQPQPQPV
jgi:membrane protein YdbS with pleckstrin-like domain